MNNNWETLLLMLLMAIWGYFLAGIIDDFLTDRRAFKQLEKDLEACEKFYHDTKKHDTTTFLQYLKKVTEAWEKYDSTR